MYQSEYGNKKFDENNVGLMEFELALFGDVYMQLKQGNFRSPRSGCIPDQISWIGNMNDNEVISEKSYRDLIKKIAKEKHINSEDFYKWAGWFGLYDRNYSNKGYNFSNESYGTAIINSLLGMLDECYE